MHLRLSPSFVVAVLALVVAAGGAGFAAGQITSGQIKDGAVRSRDIADDGVQGRDLKDGSVAGRDLRDGTVTGADVRNGSLARAELDRSCRSTEASLFGGCVRRAPSGPSTFQVAINDCNVRGGRLPTTAETLWIAAHTEFGWADGNPSQYEFTGDYTGNSPYTPIGFDRAGNSIDNASAQFFWHHCVMP